jgi:orotidine-5'-phosphate decarboxylase
MSHSEKIIVALDVSSLEEAQKLVTRLAPAVRIFKIGKELFTSAGPAAVDLVHRSGAKVFLDLKFHDIPNTVGSASAAAARMGVFMLNVHTLGGKNMLFQAVQSVHQAVNETNGVRPKILGVTVLTSMTDRDLKEVGIRKGVKKEVADLALMACQCGLDGVVASGQEIKIIRKTVGKNFLIVTPGVRPVWAGHGDQKRVMTPREAIDEGADYIVIGRPITQDPDPLAAAEKIIKEIE